MPEGDLVTVDGLIGPDARSAPGPVPQRWRVPSGLRGIGDETTRCTHLPDGDLQLDPARWFVDRSPAVPSSLLDDDGMLPAGIGALLVEHRGARVLLDAGVGRLDRCGDPSGLTGRWRGGSLLSSLRSVGVDPAEIDVIALTHLHVDHAGWLLRPEGLEAFRRARIAVSATEWSARAQRTGPDVAASALERWEGRVTTFTDGDLVAPGVTARVTGGHTSGHAVFEVELESGRLLVLGDAVHTPLQVEHPSWQVAADEDSAAAVTVRQDLCALLAEPGTTGYAVHFADVVFGRAVPAPGGGWRWDPVPTTAR